MKLADMTTDEAAAELMRKLDELRAERERRKPSPKQAKRERLAAARRGQR